MIGYKGFNLDWTCHQFEFEVGKTFTFDGEISLCNSGFHFCENPMDLFAYYPPTGKFATVEADGVDSKRDSDSKRVCRSITIKTELSISAIVAAGVKFVFDHADWSKKESNATGYRGAASATGYSGAASATGDRGAASATGYIGAASATGDRGAASATGYSGAASATGYRGAASATGDSGAASVEGKESVAIVTGKDSKAAGALGCWIVLTERDDDWHIIEVKAFKVDGKKIKPGIFYSLSKGVAIKAT